MRTGISVIMVLSCLATPVALASDDEPTSLAAAQAAIDANLRTPDGKAYDETLGGELLQKHRDTLKQCRQNAAGKAESFWMLLKLDKTGAVEELLLHPTTAMGICARAARSKG